MITISVSNLGKRFNREWIFRNINKQFTSGISCAITGANGSGKSTLLQILGGSTLLSEGTVHYSLNGEIVDPSRVFEKVSLAAPYLELIEEMTLTEFLTFHAGLKPLLNGISIREVISIIGLEHAASKQIRYYSSGMKQRVKLAQAIFSNTDVVLFDEPCTNLDTAGIELYLSLVDEYCKHRLVIVASNDKAEYAYCEDVVELRRQTASTSLSPAGNQ